MMLRCFAVMAFLLATAASQSHPVPDSERWLTYQGGDGPGRGKHIVLIAAEQEYRAEQAMPMLAAVLATHHGFHCTVLFAQNPDGLVDPTQKTPPDENGGKHDIPGLEHLASADLLILFSRFMTLPETQLRRIIDYIDSGKPLIAIRTANHGFQGPFPYEVDGKKVRFGDDVLGGAFRDHHGGWHRESTRGIVVEAQRDHPILRGVDDIWGPSDVYRTYPEGKSLPEGCTALVLGQPLTGLGHDDPPNTDKEALPVAWVKPWTGSTGKTARVFHVTMGSAGDFQSAGLRRLVINAAYWGLGLEDRIVADSCVDIVGTYEPLDSGFDYEKLGVVPKPPSAYRQQPAPTPVPEKDKEQARAGVDELPKGTHPADLAAMRSAEMMLAAERKLEKQVAEGKIEGFDRLLRFDELCDWKYSEGLAGVPERIVALSGKKVVMVGFMMPIDRVQKLEEFLLVRSLWSCCYGQAPDLHGLVRCVMPKGKPADYSFDALKLTGKFVVRATIIDGYCVDIYQLHVESLERIG